MSQAIKRTVALSNGREMPVMGLGTLFLKDKKAVHHAISQVGYRHIDTATITMNEKQVGEGVKAAIDDGSVKRNELFVATKIWHNAYADPETALRKSLKTMQMDYVDLYYVHWPNNFVGGANIPMHVLWKRMEGLVDRGLAKGIGLSNFNTQLMADMLTYATHKPICNQVCLNPQCAQTDLVRFMQDHNIVPIAYSPLGRLGSKMGPVADDMTQDPVIQELAQKHGCSATQIILSWGLSRGYVVIPKAVQAAHQEENFKALDIVLTQEEVDKVTTKLDVGKQLFKHTPDTKYNVYA